MALNPSFLGAGAPAPLAAMPIGVLVVDDQVAVREGLARLISCANIPLRGIRTAANGAEALRVAAQLHPEVIVLDVDLAGEDGLALIPQFGPHAGVLVLTSHGDSATRTRAAWLGALAFVEKHRPAADLLESIVAIGHLRMRGEKTPAPAGATSPLPLVAGSDVLADGNP
jgi:DNA-binding NarL/FixJ family response regulator